MTNMLINHAGPLCIETTLYIVCHSLMCFIFVYFFYNCVKTAVSG